MIDLASREEAKEHGGLSWAEGRHCSLSLEGVCVGDGVWLWSLSLILARESLSFQTFLAREKLRQTDERMSELGAAAVGGIDPKLLCTLCSNVLDSPLRCVMCTV